MNTRLKSVAIGVLVLACRTSTASAQQVPDAAPRATDIYVVPEDARLDAVEKSEVAAMRDGVVEKMELSIGMTVKKDGLIGTLHAETPILSMKKSKLAAESTALIDKAKAQVEFDKAVCAINLNLQKRGQGYVSNEDIRKAEAQLMVDFAGQQEAEDKHKLDIVEYELARQACEEFKIKAPFAGIVIERKKNPGEAVRANEPVVTLFNLEKMRAFAYVPTEYAWRIKVGQIVEIQPRVASDSDRTPAPVERLKFRGKVTFVDPVVTSLEHENTVRVFAEFENPNQDLRPGLKARMSVYLGTEQTVAPAPTAALEAPAPTAVEVPKAARDNAVETAKQVDLDLPALPK